ncbi:MAG: hypothetical protein ACP5NM_05555 [Thiomonas sp.]
MPADLPDLFTSDPNLLKTPQKNKSLHSMWSISGQRGVLHIGLQVVPGHPFSACHLSTNLQHAAARTLSALGVLSTAQATPYYHFYSE